MGNVVLLQYIVTFDNGKDQITTVGIFPEDSYDYGMARAHYEHHLANPYENGRFEVNTFPITTYADYIKSLETS